jgi:putative transposase
MAKQVIERHQISQRQTSAILGISLTVLRYTPKIKVEDERIADWLMRLTTAHKRWGFGLCYLYLRNVQHMNWNHKRVYRIYRELELNLRIKPRRRIKRTRPERLSVPSQSNQVWSMDFMSDNLNDGRSLRTFNVLDDYNREGLGIEVALSLPSERVIRSLEQIIEWRGKPCALRCDNGPEYISQKLQDWANSQRITLLYIQPGKPTQNAYVERFNRTVRHEWLDMHCFESIEEAQALATKWLYEYNHERPHMALGGVPPCHYGSAGANAQPRAFTPTLSV